MYLSKGDSAASLRIGVLGGVAGSAGLEDSFSMERCLPPSVGIARLGLEPACSFPLVIFDFGVDASLGILFLVSTGDDTAGIPVCTVSEFETLRADFSLGYPGILLPCADSPGFGIPLVLGAIGNELGGDLVGVLEPPGVGNFDSTALLEGVVGIVGMRDWFTTGPSGSVTLDPPGVGNLDSGALFAGVVGCVGMRDWLEAGSSCFGVDLVNDGILLIPIGIPVPCWAGTAPGILLLVESLTGDCTSAVPFCLDSSSFWLSFLVTEGILDLGIDDLLNDGILLSCLAGSCLLAVGSLFSLAESGLFCESVEDAGILLVGFSFCEALSLRPVVGIWDLFTASCPLSPLFLDGILLLGGVRSSLPFCLAMEGIRETCESGFSALAGERASDGILDISLLLPERERLPSIEFFEGDLNKVLEVKLLLLYDLLMSPSVSSLLTIGELVLDWPLGRATSLFSRLTPGEPRCLVTSLPSR